MHKIEAVPLPEAFCWTRFGSEAGETFDRIVVRKEQERAACRGVFYWGIGSGVGPALSALVASVDEPEILFSPIKGSPRPVDVAPAHVVRWLRGTGLFGETVTLPEDACVTSRWDPLRPNVPRYALVCAREQPLCLEHLGDLEFSALRNLCSDARVGASQVTAVVRRRPEGGGEGSRTYAVARRARLVWPYLIRLSDPMPVDSGDRSASYRQPASAKMGRRGRAPVVAAR